MKPIAIWYHCLFRGTVRPIDEGFAINLMSEQMQKMEAVGLARAAKEIWIGVNGDRDDSALAMAMAPAGSIVIAHGAGSCSEITTLNVLSAWSKQHAGWNVLYFHSKGISHPESPNIQWRLNMEHHVLENWQTCISDLDAGYDAVGCYWLTPEEHRGLIRTPFFGGTFFWAKSEYLASLPPLPAPTFENRYEAEGWIGSRNPRPNVKNYISGWPPAQ